MAAAVTDPPAAPPLAGAETYVGPRPFETGEPLFGRDRETIALTSLFVAERVVLLYSPSGAGKTSLIQAGLVPQLCPPAGTRGAPALPRTFHVPTKKNERGREVPAVIRVHTPLPAELAPPGKPPLANRYVLSALGSLEEHRPKEERRELAALKGMTLADYIADEFPTQFPRPGGKGEDFRPTALIIDQFEEVLTADPTDTDVKREFFKQLGALLDDPERWVLIAIREDHLAALDPFLPLLPTRLSARYRLDRLKRAAALDAIILPADRAVGTPEGKRGVGFDSLTAAILVDDLRRTLVQQPDNSFATKIGSYVEPVYLQVVCKSLWEMKKNRTAADPVTLDDFGGLGKSEGEALQGADQVPLALDWMLAWYYRTKVAEAAAASQLEEGLIRDWFEKELITSARSRRPVLRGEEERFGITPAARKVLDGSYLIREDARGGARWLELAHDRLVEPILRDNARWRAEASGEQGEGGGERVQNAAAAQVQIGVDWVLAWYYRTKVAEAAAAGGVGERLIRDWFEKKLITLARSRRPIQRGEDESFGITPKAREVLDKAFLIREDARGGAYWLELAHDRLVEPILRDNAQWRADKLHPFQRDAALCAETKQECLLLAGAALKEAETWAAAHPDMLADEDRQFLDACRERQALADQKEAERAAQVRSRYVGIGIGVLFGLLAVVLVLFVTGRQAGKRDAERAQRDQATRTWLANQEAQRQFENRQKSAEALRNEFRFALAEEQTSGEARAIRALALLQRAQNQRLNLPEAESHLRQALHQIRATQGVGTFGGAVRVIAFSPNGKWVVIGGENGFTHLHDLERGGLPDVGFGELLGPKDGITAAAFSPGEDYVILGQAGSLRAFKLGSREPPQPNDFPRHTSAIKSIHVARAEGAGGDGWIVTVGSDGTGYLFRWKPGGGAPIALNKIGRAGTDYFITSVGFTPVPKKLFTGTTNGEVYAWDLKAAPPRPTPLRNVKTDTAVAALAVHPAARFLAVGTFRANLKLWPMDPATKEIADLVNAPVQEVPTGALESILVHHSGRWLATVTREQTVELFRNGDTSGVRPNYHWVEIGPGRIELGPPFKWDLGPDASGRAIVVTFDAPGAGPGGRDLFLAGYPDGTARLWNLSRVGEAPYVLPGRRSAVTAVAIRPNQATALIGYQDGTVTVWDIGSVLGEADSEPRVIRAAMAPVAQLSLSPGGRRFVAVDQIGRVVSGPLDPSGGAAARVSWTGSAAAFPAPDGAVALVGWTDPRALTLSRWTAPDKIEPVGSVRFPDDMRPRPALSADRNWAALLDKEATAVTLLRVRPSLAVVAKIPIPAQPGAPEGAPDFRPAAAALSADGRVLVCAVGPRVLVWRLDPTSGQADAPKLLFTEQGEGHGLVVAVSPDGRRIALGGSGGAVGVWDQWDDERARPRYRSHRKAVTALAFTEDGNRLVSGSEDATAAIWDLRTSSDAVVLSGHTGPIRAVAVSPVRDARPARVVTAGDDGTVRVWTLDRGELIKRAGAILREFPP